MTKELMTAAEAAAYIARRWGISVSSRTLQRWSRSGQIVLSPSGIEAHFKASIRERIGPEVA